MSGSASQRCALVAGSLGLVGSRLLVALHDAGWTTMGIARGAAPEAASAQTRHRHLQLNLCDADACREQLAPLASEVTHVFFAARASDPDPLEETRANLAMLTHLLDPLQGPRSALTHVCLVHGSKWYGSHLGPYPTPA
ncbi:MAG: dependent epimerase/dehydratase family protein, partial [Rhizobacter sp.]|nr:dependent epimerase/dehydratase family protein [Rhizobacter sp.]